MSTLQPYLTASAQLVLGTGGTLELQALPSAGVAAQLAPFYKGDKGDKGEPGLNGAGFDFTQPTPATTWTIAHNLGLRPSVAIFTPGGLQVMGTALHLSADVLQISFSTPTAGTARLN
jgi:hypothetical protein